MTTPGRPATRHLDRGAETLGQVDLIAIPCRQIGLHPGKFVAIFGAAHVAAPGASKGEGVCGKLVLRLQPLQPAGKAGLVAPVHQLPFARCHLPQQGPVIDADRHVRDGDVAGGQVRQTLEATAQIIAKQAERPADEGQGVA